MQQANGDVTVAELNALCNQMKEKKAEIDAKELELTELNKQLGKMKQQASAYLAELGQDKYITPFGELKRIERWQTKNPATEDDKRKLFDWMRERGIYDTYATVNARSLNSLFIKERAIAEAEGQDPMLFTLPGMEPATLFEDVDFKPKK